VRRRWQYLSSQLKYGNRRHEERVEQGPATRLRGDISFTSFTQGLFAQGEALATGARLHGITLADYGTARAGGAEGKESTRTLSLFPGVIVGKDTHRATQRGEISPTQATIGCAAGEVKGGRDGKREHSRGGR
jgi:hypothetical protein